MPGTKGSRKGKRVILKPVMEKSEPAFIGGRYWNRTSDPLHVKQVL